MFASFAILLVFQCLGEGIVFIFGLPVPGPVAGMLLLLGALLAWPRLQSLVDEGAWQLLSHLSLLFVPAGAGIVAAASVGNGHWLARAIGPRSMTACSARARSAASTSRISLPERVSGISP